MNDFLSQLWWWPFALLVEQASCQLLQCKHYRHSFNPRYHSCEEKEVRWGPCAASCQHPAKDFLLTARSPPPHPTLRLEAVSATAFFSTNSVSLGLWNCGSWVYASATLVLTVVVAEASQSLCILRKPSTTELCSQLLWVASTVGLRV